MQIVFDEDILSHSEAYFSELNRIINDIIDITDKNKPKSLEDYHYLIGTKHYYDEDDMEYKVNRIANQSGYIVAFRISILSDGSNRWEDTIAIHIVDIVRMTNSHVNSGAS